MVVPRPHLLASPLRGLGAISVALAITACGSRGSEQIEFARAALERNPNVEIVAVDAKAGIFTVKDVATGEVRTVRADELQASPTTPAAPAVAQPATDASSAIAPGEAATPVPEPAATTDSTTTETATAAAESTPAGTDMSGAETVAPEATSAVPPVAGTGRVVASGPGYSITRASGAKPAPASDAPARASAELRLDPIRCQGQRFMRIDGQTLEFASDAIIAEDGCDLHITNARIRAEGVALVVRNARVHVTNSTIAGRSASLEASGTSEVFSSGSTFDGITRRFDESKLSDLGGSTFRQ
jgi:hypothetical protein